MCRETGYSSVIPFAPRMVRALRAMSRAARTLARLAIDTWTGCNRPSSLSVPSRCASRRPWTIAVAMFASFCWVSCIAPIGLPKARRVWLYSSADSKQARAAPMVPQAMPNRASLRHDRGPRIPVTPGSTALSGTRIESNDSSDVTDARRDSLLWTSDVVKPRVPRSTRKPRTPESVIAQTTATSAMEPLVIHILVPLMTQSPPSPRAVVCIEEGSEPASGSVSPKQPIARPAAISGSQRDFCSSLPYAEIGNIASEPCTDTKDRNPLSPASSSSLATPYAVAEAPAHP